MGAMRPASRHAARFALALGAGLAIALLAGCATTSRDQALDQAQYAWSAAIRWGDFDGAWQMVDPAWRDAHPLTDLERARYDQVQVSFYRDAGGTVGAGTAQRAVEIGVVNRHTLEERQLRHVEHWRWDEAAGTWWITDGLPDFWRDPR